jgi:hypothetical protein
MSPEQAVAKRGTVSPIAIFRIKGERERADQNLYDSDMSLAQHHVDHADALGIFTAFEPAAWSCVVLSGDRPARSTSGCNGGDSGRGGGSPSDSTFEPT